MRLPHPGSWPRARVVWGLAIAFCAWTVVDVLVLGTTRGLGSSTYDAMVRYRLVVPPPDPRIVIIDIDEASLVRMAPEFGRWPWPRDTLATVLTYLEAGRPAAIVWDILFSDADVLNPGGDAAFDAAVRKSTRSHFSVVRLPAGSDPESVITRSVLPGLWAVPGSGGSSVAMIPPVLPAVAAAPLGYDNSYPDPDGVVRRFRFLERLPDGGVLKSSAFSAVAAVNPVAAAALLAHVDSAFHPSAALLTWRRSPDVYRRVPFWSVFRQADRGAPPTGEWKDKILIIGSTAPTLHDSHASPVARSHPGPQILAVAIDNALHGEAKAELPKPLLAAVGVLLCIGIALWAQLFSVASLEPLMLGLPMLLLAISFATLQAGPLFLELQAPAALALAFLVALRVWGELRRRYWCAPPLKGAEHLAVLPLVRRRAWPPQALDRLIELVERVAPRCRIVAADTWVRWPGRLRWPELAQYAAIVGPASAVSAAEHQLRSRLARLGTRTGSATVTGTPRERHELARLCLKLWAEFPQAGVEHRQEERIA